MKDGFIFHFENEEELEDLTIEEQGLIFIAMRAYAKDGTEPEFEDRALKIAWKPIKRRLDKDSEAYEKRCEKNRENGSRGGRPKNQSVISDEEEKPKETQKNQSVFSVFEEKPKKADTDTDTDTDIKENIKEKTKWIQRQKPAKRNKNAFINFEQRDYDLDNLAAVLDRQFAEGG